MKENKSKKLLDGIATAYGKKVKIKDMLNILTDEELDQLFDELLEQLIQEGRL